jgi:hypothetical protein
MKGRVLIIAGSDSGGRGNGECPFNLNGDLSRRLVASDAVCGATD